jgi:hypothetical protein
MVQDRIAPACVHTARRNDRRIEVATISATSAAISRALRCCYIRRQQQQ